jgi:hypothetical protein
MTRPKTVEMTVKVFMPRSVRRHGARTRHLKRPLSVVQFLDVTHHLTSGSTHIDSADIEDMIKHVVHHGSGRFGALGAP